MTKLENENKNIRSQEMKDYHTRETYIDHLCKEFGLIRLDEVVNDTKAKNWEYQAERFYNLFNVMKDIFSDCEDHEILCISQEMAAFRGLKAKYNMEEINNEK